MDTKLIDFRSLNLYSVHQIKKKKTSKEEKRENEH